MMSKNSFLVSMKENNKRRIWLWIISALFWFFYYPVYMAMAMSRWQEYNRLNGLIGAAAQGRLEDATYEWLKFNQVATILSIIIIAIVCAIQGFSYLYSRKKVDMYHSVPVKKSRRFAVISINGVLIFFIPYAINLFLAMLVAWMNGGMNGDNFTAAMLAMCLNLLLFMGVYGLSLIAVMLTGNLVVTILAVLVFLAYELVVKMILEEYKRSFFSCFSIYSEDSTVYSSPVTWVVKAIEEVEEAGGAFGAVLCPSLFVSLLLAAVFIGIAYFCYLKRPAEAAGKAIAFEKSKAIIKLFLTVPFSLGIFEIVDNIAGSNDGLILFGMVMAVILSNCLIEVIYESDIKAAFRKKYQILVSGGCTAVIFCVFAFDLTGYDAWSPSPDKLESASFLFYGANRWSNYVNEDLTYMGTEDYALSKQGITDIEAICQLSENKADGEEAVVWFDVAYRMKGGKVVWRNFAVDAQQNELLDRIIGSEEFKRAAYQLYDDDSFEFLKKCNVKELAFNNGFRIDNLPPEDLEMIREAWKKDMQSLSYKNMRDEFSCGKITVNFNTGQKWSRFELDIYPSFTNVIEALKERGIDAGKVLDTEYIESITVCNFHSEERDVLYQQMLEENGWNQEAVSWSEADVSVTKTFSEREKIEELAEAMYHTELTTAWKLPDALDRDYSITVRYKDGQVDDAVYRGSSNSVYLIADKVPSWLESETAYK